MQPPEVDEHFITSFDGTKLAYHVAGEGPPLLLCNGLGGSWKAWSHQITYLRDRYRFISWDYRGLYRSSPPGDADALAVPHHAQDALAIMEAEGIERAVFLGWSMGVQVALESFRIAPERVAGLALMNGVSGKIWDSALDLGFMDKVLPPAIRAVGTMPRAVEAVVRRAVGIPDVVGWAKRFGLAARSLDEDIFAELAGSFEDLDMGVYLRVLELLGDHDASDMLGDVDVPTLVIAGDKDLFTPRSAAQRMVQGVAGAELYVIPGATHYAAVEFPELVNLRLEKFLLERGYAPDAA